jgi:hypothetical protein
MAAPSAGDLYSACMQSAGDLVESIQNDSRSSLPADVRAAANKQNAQAALALIQGAVTIHAASKTASTRRAKV